MPSLTERIRSAVKAYQNPSRPAIQPGEIALADPRRLFPQGFTPYNPSWLVTRQGLQIYDLMLRDDQVKSAIRFKQHAVVASGWKVHSPEGKPDDWEPTRYVQHVLEGLEGTLEDDLLEILSALVYGYSVTEKVWGATEGGPFAGRIALRALKTRHPNSFDFETDGYGNLKPDGVLQHQRRYNPVRLPASKFIIYTHELEFSNIYGRSDLEAAYPAWWTKDNARKWFAMYLERYAIPWFFFLYDQRAGYTPEQVDDLKKIATNLQAATQGVIPRPGGQEALELWTQQPQGRTQAEFIPALQELDRQIARAILMPGHLGLTADLGQGSFARAKVNFDVFMLVVEKIRRDLERRVMAEQIIKPLVDQNYGVDNYPVWRFMPLAEDDRAQILDKWLAAVQAGVVRPQPNDEVHVREILKFPQTETPDLPPPASPDSPESQAREREIIERPEPQVRFQRARERPHGHRYDRRVNYARIESGLSTIEFGAGHILRPLFVVARDRLLQDVERNFPGKPGFVNELKIRGFGDIQDALREFVRRAYGIGEETMRMELPRTFQESVGFVPADALRWLAQKAVTISGVLNNRLVDQAKQVLLNALKFGEPQADTLRKLREVFEPYVGDPTLLRDGESIDPFRLETLLRTNATEAFNEGRLVTARHPGLAGFIRGMEYSAVLDDRTTQVCRFLDGKVVPLDEPELDRLTPPNHFNCRSVLVPVTIDMQVDEADLITPEEIGRAEMLAGEGFK